MASTPTGRGRLEGKVSLITGSAAGLGRVAAELFAREGSRVVVADLGDGSDTVEAIRAAGGEASYVRCDVSDEDAVRAAVRHAVDTYGGLHVLYNNAGVSLADDDGPENTPVEVWDTTLRVNVTGLALGCKHGIPAMLDTLAAAGDEAPAGGCSIINVASFVAHLGAATPQIAYTASKGAVLSMTREIAVIYARRGIRANALCPGPVLTPLLAKYMADEEQRQRRLVHIPMGRFGEPHEIANGALFLASDESSFMTGQSLLVDGGITAAYTTPL
ncbi:MAG TPA: SDR family oxidoreductase [Microthrixaceae bacterium]|nr:SDR family oxidoreductase [Microthrixaceae bacterium]